MHPFQEGPLSTAPITTTATDDTTLHTLDTPKEQETTTEQADAGSSVSAVVSSNSTTDLQINGTQKQQEQQEQEQEQRPKHPVYDGDGTDPYHTQIPEQSPMDWVAYTVSLNYNRLATSLFQSITRWHWYDRIPNTPLILGAVPSEQLLVQLQKEEHVQDIINMCAEFSGHLDKMQELELRQCWIPTKDFHTPTLESIWTGVRYIEKWERRCGSKEVEDESLGTTATVNDRDRSVMYLHCKAGRGRSATVALSWLVFAYKLTRLEAQAILLKARGQVDKNVHLHPEVIAFEQEVQEQEKQGSIVRKDWPGTLRHY